MADAKVESKADKDRRQALELALSQIERQFGKGAVMKRPGRSRSTWPSGSAGFPAGASPRSTGRSRRARPRWPST